MGMKCPRCGKRLERREEESFKDFQKRWERDECECPARQERE